ncbi:hypothetical protein GQ457_02G021510 [Hibiscus cannabinus]
MSDQKMKMEKYYVVFHEKKADIYRSWIECAHMIIDIKESRFESFESESDAKEALDKFWVFVFKLVSPLGRWLIGICLDFEAITVITFDINMNSLCFVACWYGGQKICACHYRWIV